MTKRILALLILLAALVIATLPAVAQLNANNARGFDPAKAYQFGDLDHVNLFNGNLIVTIPIGQTYRVSDHLSWQLRLVYNGNPWDYRTEPVPSRFANAGLGWQLGFGELVGPNNTYAKIAGNEYRWVYAAPDGAERVFYRSLHEEENGNTTYEAPQSPAAGEVVGYTRDGSYLRLTRLAPVYKGQEIKRNGTEFIVFYRWVAAYRVDFPDGTRHTMTSEVYETEQSGTPDAAYEKGLLYRVTKMEDRFGNSVEIDYAGTTWTITEKTSAGTLRTHTMAFTNMQYYQYYGNPQYGNLVSTVTMAAFGNKTVAYKFDYGNYEQISAPCVGESSLLSPKTSVVLLNAVRAVDPGTNQTLLQYSFDYVRIEKNSAGADVCSNRSGHLTKLNLPTGGWIEYTPGIRIFPTEKTGQPGDHDGPTHPEVSTAVGSRKVYESAGKAAATWKYDSYLRKRGLYNDENGTPRSMPHELVVIVTDPLQQSTANYFSIYKNLGATTCVSGADAFEYGLPFTRGHTLDGLQLSTETFAAQCATFTETLVNGCPASSCKDSAGNAVATLRREYVAYDRDTVGATSEPGHHNARVRASRTVYVDDRGCKFGSQNVDCWTGTTLSGFDGLGHYRSAERTGNLSGTNANVSSDPRTVTTNYNANPTAGSYVRDNSSSPSSYMIPRTNEWLPNRYNRVSTTENDVTANEEACFDARGFLTRKRLLAANAAGANDLLTVYSETGGNVTSEKQLGGDVSPMDGMVDHCNDNPGTATYQLTHTYASGVRVASQYQGASFKSLDLSVDASTGFPATVRDTAEFGQQRLL